MIDPASPLAADDVWGQLDHQRIKLELQRLREDRKSFAARIVTDEASVQLKEIEGKRLAGIYVDLVTIDMVLQRCVERSGRCISEAAEQTYKIYCDVWAKQAKEKSEPFVRAVWDKAIAPQIEEHESYVVERFRTVAGVQEDNLEEATRQPFYAIASLNAHIKSLKQTVDALRQRFKNKVDLEASDCEYAAKRQAAANIPLNSFPAVQSAQTASPSDWRQLHDEFMNVVTEERKHNLPRLIASSVPWPDGREGVGWMVHQSPTEKIKADFELLATRAGRALGQSSAAVDGPLNHWLNALQRDLSDNRSKMLRRFTVSRTEKEAWGRKENAWVIKSVCEASGVLCSRLEKAAIEAAPVRDRGARPKAPAQKRRTQQRTAAQLLRQRVIFGAIQSGMEGLDYCRELDSRKLQILPTWKEGGADKYEGLYKKGDPWRKRIQDEKNRYATMSKKLAPAELEKIIQGDPKSTRSTRS